MSSIKESDEKPSIEDFKLGKPLGEGNFSRIMLATHAASGEVFALKVIEKQRVKRLRIRHANIFNEINMEKEVLNRLRHPNIVRLYHTFQDEGNLYFLLEYVEGGELLEHVVHEGRQIGLHEDLARFYLADIVNALEFMHANQVIHRDLKPENMVVCAKDGHLRLIDFGTAKDLANPALNGPNFVGTPEYMSPETIDNKDATYASDMWALGCIAFQLLAGETPFSGGSAYLTFLKVQHGQYQLPEFISSDARDLITRLLTKDPATRPSIAEVKTHPFFRGTDFATHMSTPKPLAQFHDERFFRLIEEIRAIENQRHETEPLNYSMDSVQPKVAALSGADKSLLMHLLQRKQMLQLPSVYARFFDTPSQGRCLYAQNGGYVGFSHDMQNQWGDPFSFMMLAGPRLGHQTASLENAVQGGSLWNTEVQNFRRAIGTVNTHKPAFVVIIGDIVNAPPGTEMWRAQIAAFQSLVDEISPEIKLVFVPGACSLGTNPDVAARELYESIFGDDRYSFWHGGIKFIVIDSGLIAQNSVFPDLARQQEEWFVKELDNGKLCARETVLLSAHSFYSLVEGPELPPHLAARMNQSQHNDTIPETTRKRYLGIISKNPPRLVVTAQGDTDRITTVHTARNPKADDDDDDEADVKKTEQVVCRAPFSSSSAIYIARVVQTGITIERVVSAVGNAGTTLPGERKVCATPEEVDGALTSEAIRLEISS